jgi:hypothetical protein
VVFLTHCLECACEKVFGKVVAGGVFLASSGAGCPLEPNEDGGPWQENAIRALEEDR